MTIALCTLDTRWFAAREGLRLGRARRTAPSDDADEYRFHEGTTELLLSRDLRTQGLLAREMHKTCALTALFASSVIFAACGRSNQSEMTTTREVSALVGVDEGAPEQPRESHGPDLVGPIRYPPGRWRLAARTQLDSVLLNLSHIDPPRRLQD